MVFDSCVRAFSVQRTRLSRSLEQEDVVDGVSSQPTTTLNFMSPWFTACRHCVRSEAVVSQVCVLSCRALRSFLADIIVCGLSLGQ